VITGDELIESQSDEYVKNYQTPIFYEEDCFGGQLHGLLILGMQDPTYASTNSAVVTE
jgi:hypothetical protein